MRITTGKLASALRPFVGAYVNDDKVREWAEEGIIMGSRDPFKPGTRFYFEPDSIQQFLRDHQKTLQLTDDNIKEVLDRLNINFRQLTLLVA